MKKPIVGQTLFLMPLGNQARRSKKLQPVKVFSVGSKYFKVKNEQYGWVVSFHIGNWREVTNYSANWQAFESEQEIIDLLQSAELYTKIRNAFSYGSSTKYTLAQLKQVAEIVNLQN